MLQNWSLPICVSWDFSAANGTSYLSSIAVIMIMPLYIMQVLEIGLTVGVNLRTKIQIQEKSNAIVLI